ncbi:hypothetical protein VMCG_08473 [Cytospora schulzeri]|uniref:Uncharacterized protein n=1 Tax=Cytospora schulzeri TaxID=448051 RepID=A0A423VWR7_9PEZI|nr:hypothetical protein VMCG_08473 [Valsa malicola]
MPPPPPPPPDRVKAPSPIKTPRPDITMGTRHKALISALSKTLDSDRANRFLDQPQGTTKPGPRGGGGGPEEPLLIAEPTAARVGPRLPAAVSGASGLKIQLSLDDLVSQGATRRREGGVPLFFSVCTDGPYHELYVHYTVVEGGVRKFNQTLLEICNGVLLKSVVEFIVMLDNVLRWGTGRFLESVVERLGKVARRAGA